MIDDFDACLDKAIELLSNCYESQHGTQSVATAHNISKSIDAWDISNRVANRINMASASKSIVDVSSEVEYNKRAVDNIVINLKALLTTPLTKGHMTLSAGRMSDSVVLVEALRKIYESGLQFVYVVGSPALQEEMSMYHTAFDIMSVRDYALDGAKETMVIYESTGAIDFGPTMKSVRLLR